MKTITELQPELHMEIQWINTQVKCRTHAQVLSKTLTHVTTRSKYTRETKKEVKQRLNNMKKTEVKWA